jgi:flagellar biosynthesis chaperone FliJ
MKYLGVWMDETLSLKVNIRAKCKSAASIIRCVTKIRDYIDTETAKTLIVTLVLSQLDYANSILAGLPENSIAQLQRIQNWAAKVVLRRSKYDSSTKALKDLHWLPVRERVNFKILCLVHKCLHDSGPPYLQKLLVLKQSGRTTRSATSGVRLLEVPRTKKATFAARSFSVHGPTIWNSLPARVRGIDDLLSFKKEIKTLLFKNAFH